MPVGEPVSLSVIRALAGHLEVQPLVREMVLFRVWGEAEFVRLVVLRNQILDNGARFPDCNVRVRVMERREAAVGVQGEILGFLDAVHGNVLGFEGEVEFFEDEHDFENVGAHYVVAVEDEIFHRGRHCELRRGYQSNS